MRKLLTYLVVLLCYGVCHGQTTAPSTEAGSTWVKIAITPTDSAWVKITVSDIIPIRASLPDTAEILLTTEEVEIAPAVPLQASDTLSTAVVTATENASGMAAVPSPERGRWNNPKYAKNRHLRFAWGAEFGTSIDISGEEMNSVDLNALIGVAAGWFDFIGVGAGVNVNVSNSNRSYPIFAAIQTDFSTIYRPVFLDLRGGASLNYLPSNISRTWTFGSVGLGIRLVHGKKLSSFITAGYCYYDRKDVDTGEIIMHLKPLSMIQFRLGVIF